jgi:hypothetical protein
MEAHEWNITPLFADPENNEEQEPAPEPQAEMPDDLPEPELFAPLPETGTVEAAPEIADEIPEQVEQQYVAPASDDLPADLYAEAVPAEPQPLTFAEIIGLPDYESFAAEVERWGRDSKGNPVIDPADLIRDEGFLARLADGSIERSAAGIRQFCRLAADSIELRQKIARFERVSDSIDQLREDPVAVTAQRVERMEAAFTAFMAHQAGDQWVADQLQQHDAAYETLTTDLQARGLKVPTPQELGAAVQKLGLLETELPPERIARLAYDHLRANDVSYMGAPRREIPPGGRVIVGNGPRARVYVNAPTARPANGDLPPDLA